MSRLTVQKISDFRLEYLRCVNSGNYNNLYFTNALGLFGTDFKKVAECAFESYNNTRPASGSARLNKQEFYACMFCLGYPLGLIAKTLLNANLAPVRNAVLKYKEVCADYIANERIQPTANAIFDRVQRVNRTEDAFRFLSNIIDYCGYVGGLPLIDKLVYEKDIDSLMSSLGRINEVVRGTEKFSALLIRQKLVEMKDNWRSINTARRGVVRRTGLTTSRVAAATTQIPVRPNASQGVTPSALPQAQNISASTQARTPVRDIDFHWNIGVEIEVVIPNTGSERELTNNLVREMRAEKIDVQAVGYTHNTTSYWKITSDGSIRPAGVEVVSPILKGKRGLTELRRCVRAIRKAGGSVNKSVGIHVHFGANGLELDHFKNILYNYAGFEKIINATLYETRRDNIYAKNLSSIRDLTNKIDRSISFSELVRNVFGSSPDDYRGQGRYYAVNFLSFNRHGTIEFRQLQGSVEEDTIVYWIYFLHFLIEVSKRKRLSYFDDKQLRNITPVWLSTYLGNRSFDLSDNAKNFNAPS